MSNSRKEPNSKKAKRWKEELKQIKDKVEEMIGARVKMPKPGAKWCGPCRVNTHSTSECIEWENYERRGHKWEECR